MGENNCTLEPGTLFIKHPDDKEWHPFGTVLEGCVEYRELPKVIPAVVKAPEPVEMSAEPIAPPDVAALLAGIAEGLNQIMPPIIEAWQKLCEAIRSTWDAVVVDCPDISFICAYAWATVHHPEWVNRLNRTKKRRTRKKYQDRIMRAYQAAAIEALRLEIVKER